MSGEMEERDNINRETNCSLKEAINQMLAALGCD